MSPKNKLDSPVNRTPSHSSREKKQDRLIKIGFIITALLIIGMLAIGLLGKYIFPVANVNGVRINNQYFQDRVRLERNSYIQQYNLYYAQLQFLAGDPGTAEAYRSQLAQLQQFLDNTDIFANNVLDTIVDEEVINQQAAEMGLSVSDNEVEQAIQGMFSYYPAGTPTPAPTFAPATTPTPSERQLDLLNYTPTPLSLDVEANEEAAAEIETPEASGGETPVPTPTVFTEALYTERYQSLVTDLQTIGVSETSWRKFIHDSLLNEKVREEIIAEIPRDQEQVWARHILVKTQAEAAIVQERLNQGDDWSTIAAEMSLDNANKNKGGDLGWFPKGNMVAAFESAAFALEPGEISEPVATEFGYHLIQVIDKQILPLTESAYRRLQDKRFQDWFQQARDEANIKTNNIWKDLAPVEPTIPPEMRIL